MLETPTIVSTILTWRTIVHITVACGVVGVITSMLHVQASGVIPRFVCKQ